jgi:hypothetical protein
MSLESLNGELQKVDISGAIQLYVFQRPWFFASIDNSERQDKSA